MGGTAAAIAAAVTALCSCPWLWGKQSKMPEVSSVDLTSIIGDLLAIVAQGYDLMATGMKDNIIQ
jgi:hypothetical protein